MKPRYILALPAALLLPGCPAEGDARVTVAVLPTCLKVTERTVKVFRTASEWQTFYAAHGGAATNGIPNVDFARFVLATLFDGTGSACTGFTVEGAELKDGQVVVSATRHTSPNPCIAVVAYPQVVVSLDVRGRPVVFRIRDVQDVAEGQTKPCF